MNGKKLTRIIIAIILTAAAVGGLYLLQLLVTPKYVNGIVEGAFVEEYYDEYKDFDVIFIGDCEVYENFSPTVLWEEYGINSYIRGSAEQYIFQSYYLLEDTLRYEKPDVVVFNIQSMQFDRAQNEAYNRMSIEGMKWSKSKVDCINASMTGEEHFIDYVFPILRYHSRWKELTSDDIRYMFKKPKVTFNGYYMRVDVKPANNVPTGKPLGDYNFKENSWKYLNMMVDKCNEEGIRLILIKAPSLYPYWYEEWDEQIRDYADEKGLEYINFLNYTDEIGLDYTTDTYDAGLHLNLSGATKLSEYFGKYLKENAGLADRRDEAELSSIWAEKSKRYYTEIENQKQKYGIE